MDVVTRRSKFRKAKASDRLNLVDGLLKAILDIDKVVKIVRGSEDAASAKAALIKAFKLTDEQATHILDMPLRRLTKMSKVELETEQKSLKSEISNLTALLKSDEALRKKVSEELKEVSAKFATPRRTVIL
jgi:DNA gyrase/topoisomerase IV subunit A